MPKINQQLLDRLMSVLSVSSPRIYQIIAERRRTPCSIGISRLWWSPPRTASTSRSTRLRKKRAQIRGSLRPGGGSDAPSSKAKQPTARTHEQETSTGETNPEGGEGKRQFSVRSAWAKRKLRRALFDFLRALGLKPLEWEKVVLMTKKTNPYIGDILDNTMAKVQAVVVLFSPDDEANCVRNSSRGLTVPGEKTPGSAEPTFCSRRVWR